MGTWGVGLFSDDLAADLRGDFRDLIGEGLTVSAAVDKLLQEYASSLQDPEEEPVFWLALAATQWKLGRSDERTLQNALRVIDGGRDLLRWDDSSDRRRRENVLSNLRAQLLSPPPAPKRVPRPVKGTNDWAIGEVVALRLASQRWTLMRVISHHTDKGGRFPICEFLDWVGDSLPPPDRIPALPVRREASPRGISQFLFGQPRSKKSQARVVRTGLHSSPAQRPAGYTALVWPHLDRQLQELFGLE